MSPRPSPPPGPPSSALLRLLRISLFPSAVADALAGLVLGAGGWPRDPGGQLLLAAPLTVVLACLAFLHGGLVLNDWADRDGDRLTRPERPLPAGELRAGAALLLGLALLTVGLGAVLLASPAGRPLAVYPALALVLLILSYTRGPRGPLLGPLLLGACRGLNLSLALLVGMQFSNGAEQPSWLALPPLYALHVFFLARLGRLEDGEDGGPVGHRPRYFLYAAGACLLLAAVQPPLMSVDWAGPPLWALAPLAAPVVACVGLWRLRRASLLGPPWDAARLQQAMGRALGGLPLFAAVALLSALPAAGGDRARELLALAALLLLGLPLSRRLARSYPPS